MRALKRRGGSWASPLCSLLLLLLLLSASAAAGQQLDAAPAPALSPEQEADLLQEAATPAAAPAPATEQQPLPAETPEPLAAEEWDPAEVDAALAASATGSAAGGALQPSSGGELPADVAALLGPPPGTAEGDALDGPAPERPPPGERASEMISLLSPPPGFEPQPPLSEAQRAMIPRLREGARQGTATVSFLRNVGNLDGARMACGLGYLNDHFKRHFVGLPPALYRDGLLCGACVRVWCVDAACEDALVRNATFIVADSCNDCQGAGLVAGLAGLAQLSGGLNLDRGPTLQVAWAFTSCAAQIEGGIRVMPSDRTSAEFLGLQFSNNRALIRGVTLNGIRMQRTNYGYWVIDTPGKAIPLRPPYELALESAQGERVVARVPTLRPQALDVNFA